MEQEGRKAKKYPVSLQLQLELGYYVNVLSKCVITNTPTAPSLAEPPALRMRTTTAHAQCNIISLRGFTVAVSQLRSAHLDLRSAQVAEN